LASVPPDREEKSAWLKAVAFSEEITLGLAHLLGLPVVAIEEPFQCVLHDACVATLTRGRKGEVVYRDAGLTGTQREFQTLPELAAALRNGVPKRLTPFQHATWRVRMLYEASLIGLPLVEVPELAPGSSPLTVAARAGFHLLVRCRWFLEPGEPVSFTRGFAEAWCPLTNEQARNAIRELLSQGVIVKVDETASNYRNPTHLYLPGGGTVPRRPTAATERET